MPCVLLQYCSELLGKKEQQQKKHIPKQNLQKHLLTQDGQREIWLILRLCSQSLESCSLKHHSYLFLARGFLLPSHKGGDAVLQLAQFASCIRTEAETPSIRVPARAVPGLSSVCSETSPASSLPRSQSNSQSVLHHHYSPSCQIKLQMAKSNPQSQNTDNLDKNASECLLRACRNLPCAHSSPASYLPYFPAQEEALWQDALRRATDTVQKDPQRRPTNTSAHTQVPWCPVPLTCSEKVSASSVSTCPLGGNTISWDLRMRLEPCTEAKSMW